MKKTTTFLVCFVLIAMSLLAQAPQAFKYQAVARNSSGNLIQNQLVAFRIGILQGGPSGTLVYQEHHTPTTNNFGLANLEIGRGTILFGTFSSINWSGGQMFLKVELDPAGGTIYQNMGTTELLSVPYSLYSERSSTSYWERNGSAIFYTNGPVGIGTSSPTSPLDVRGSNPDDGALIKVGNGDLSHFMMLSGGRTSDPNPMIFWRDGDPLRFCTDQSGGSEKMRITSDGQLGIGITSPESSAILDLTSNTKGLLIPRMTQAQRNAIVNPANGLMIYQTDNTPGYYYNSGSSSSPSWITLAGSGSVSGWSLTGNSGTDPSVNFLGTTDNHPLKFRVNNLKAGEINPVNDNLLLGRQAGENTTGSNNVAIGSYALKSNVANLRSTAIGYGAMYNADNRTVGQETFNTAVGYEALKGGSNPTVNTGVKNTAIGDQALYSNVTGNFNTALGNQALFFNAGGYSNTAVGSDALHDNFIGNYNTAIGNAALFHNTIGNANTANGTAALYENTEGINNTANGYGSLFNNTLGNSNTADGTGTLYQNTTGNYNTALGFFSLHFNKANSRSTAIGFQAMYNADDRTTGQETYNTAVGYEALKGSTTPANNTGTFNTAIGDHALFSISDGNYNTAIGSAALEKNTSGIVNTSIGSMSLWQNTSGSYNTANGCMALSLNFTGSNNTAMGAYAAYDCDLDNNTSIGANSGGYDFSQSTFIGAGAHSSWDDLTNCMALGYQASVGESNKAVIGNSFVISIGGYANWTNFSDGRYKKNIHENVPGIEFIKQLRPVTFTLDITSLETDMDKYKPTILHNGQNPYALSVQDWEGIATKEEIVYTGFIAQEVEQVAQKIGYNFSGVDAPQNENGHYGLRYAEFVVPLVKAVQEQQAMIEELRKEIEELKSSK